MMRKLLVLLGALSIGLTVGAAMSAKPPTSQGGGFIPLFSGTGLKGWTGDTVGYRAEGEVVVAKPLGNLYTEAEYADFILRFDFKLTPGANNGIGIRVPMNGKASRDGLEIQILDDTWKGFAEAKPYQRHGSVYGIVPAKTGHLKPLGEWNEQEIRVEGMQIRVALNGNVVVDADLTPYRDGAPTPDGKNHPGLKRTRGHISLAGHKTQLFFRNMYIKPIESILFVAGGADWERSSRVLLQNFDNMYNPSVVETATEYRYKMWFFGWAAAHTNPNVPGCDAIYHARSKDLENWEVYAGNGKWDDTMSPSKWVPVLHSGDNWYESWHSGDPSVVLRNHKYYMAYSATSKPFGQKILGYPAGMVQCVMGAVSNDGIDWKKTERPLLIRSEDKEHPEPEPNRVGDFHRPCLRYEDNRWRLWFDYRIGSRGGCVGLAENAGGFIDTDGFEFRQNLSDPILTNWPNPEVIRVGEMYHCFSDPGGFPIARHESGWKSRQLREAISADGLTWQKLDYILPDDDSDACHVPQVLRTTVDGKDWLYLFYATQIGNRKNDGVYHYQYDRIRAMRRPIEQ